MKLVVRRRLLVDMIVVDLQLDAITLLEHSEKPADQVLGAILAQLAAIVEDEVKVLGVSTEMLFVLCQHMVVRGEERLQRPVRMIRVM